ncbi:hypothetical protein POM88_035086 [Heracleum sosnowskyi]|uniref:TF-B3 domain-containing protein n=1 Tax=Heracleum sosnowskyi TaxID=360622 RepID=A0AAD8HKR5_9APIA|nr:hypothetical protein POM88_035086 [Heracleum sosnowskyi]
MKLKIETMKNPNLSRNKSRKRKQLHIEDLDAGSLRLGWFGSYTSEEEEEERYLGVSMKLNLSINGNESADQWKIKKTLEQSDYDHLCRLMLPKDMVQTYIIKVWADAGKVEEIAQVLSDEGVGLAVKVWDYERGKEYELNFKKLKSSQCFIVSGAWSNKFVKERRLKKGDTIGLYWSTSKSSFVFSVRARAPTAA